MFPSFDFLQSHDLGFTLRSSSRLTRRTYRTSIGPLSYLTIVWIRYTPSKTSTVLYRNKEIKTHYPPLIPTPPPQPLPLPPSRSLKTAIVPYSVIATARRRIHLHLIYPLSTLPLRIVLSILCPPLPPANLRHRTSARSTTATKPTST
jgi:hypothetical protein